jgi:hypothetical protein
MRHTTITKKRIQAELRTMNPTNIFKIAKMCGVDVSRPVHVMRFVEEYAPTKRIEKAAYGLTLCADHANQLKTVHGRLEQPIMNAMAFMRIQINNGTIHTNYRKVLIEGNRNIYWAHPGYRHSDYNKHIAFPNTERNRRVMNLINICLNKRINPSIP